MQLPLTVCLVGLLSLGVVACSGTSSSSGGLFGDGGAPQPGTGIFGGGLGNSSSSGGTGSSSGASSSGASSGGSSGASSSGGSSGASSSGASSGGSSGASSSGASSSGASSSGSTGNACISNPTTTCDQCLNQSCCPLIEACAHNADCAALVTCVSKCGSDQTCAQDCLDQYANGQPGLKDIVSCARQSCPGKC
jgi:hypothetical protein